MGRGKFLKKCLTLTLVELFKNAFGSDVPLLLFVHYLILLVCFILKLLGVLCLEKAAIVTMFKENPQFCFWQQSNL